jgi:hypothetical protein
MTANSSIGEQPTAGGKAPAAAGAAPQDKAAPRTAEAYLQQQSQWAGAAMNQLCRELLHDAVATADLRAWAARHPVPTVAAVLGAGAIGGLAVGRLLRSADAAAEPPSESGFDRRTRRRRGLAARLASLAAPMVGAAAKMALSMAVSSWGVANAAPSADGGLPHEPPEA